LDLTSFKRAVSATNDASKISSSMIIRYDHAVVSRVLRSESQGSGLKSDEICISCYGLWVGTTEA